MRWDSGKNDSRWWERWRERERVTEGNLLGIARTRLYSLRHTPGLWQVDNVLWYEVATSSFLSSVFPHCHLTHHLHLPFPLCSLLTLFTIQFSNWFSSLSSCLFSQWTRISQGNYSSPHSPITHPSVTFQHIPRLGLCSDYDSINTVWSYMTSLKLDLCCVALQSSFTSACPFAYKGQPCVYYSSTIRVRIVPNISYQDVCSLTVFISSTTWKDISLYVSIACPGSVEDRSVEVSKATLLHP